MEGEVLVYRLLLERRKTLDARQVRTWQNLCVSLGGQVYLLVAFEKQSWTAFSACRANALLCQRERCTRKVMNQHVVRRGATEHA